MLTIQYLCKKFRERVLEKTLKELSNESGVKLSTISAFENGRSNNINHLSIYYQACTNDTQREAFIVQLQVTLGAVENEK